MGVIISVEGGDYVGKTSFVIPFLKTALSNYGFNVKTSREPGGSAKAEILREEIFLKRKQGATALQLALLFNKARKIHLKQTIIPYLEGKKENQSVMLLDRYLDSTRVYQGLEGGVPMKKIISLEKEYVGIWYPNLTIILYINWPNFKTILTERMLKKRIEKNGVQQKTAWDDQAIEDHWKRQEYYLKLPEISNEYGENRKFVLIDVSEPSEVVLKKCLNSCLEVL